MKIDLDEIRKMAKMSYITLSAEQENEMLEYFEKMLKKTEMLNNIDLDAIAPTVHILSAVNVLREDIAAGSMDRELLLKNAPERDENAYVVPRVVE